MHHNKTKILSVLLLLGGLISTGFGQNCPDGMCPLPRGVPYSPPSFEQPYRTPPNDVLLPAEIEQEILKASVKVTATRIFTASVGSGTIVKYYDRVMVLTAAHVLRGNNRVYIRNSYIDTVPCRIVYVDQIVDWAILEPLEKQDELHAIGVDYLPQALVQPGEQLCFVGYSGGNTPRIRYARFKRYISDNRGTKEWMEVAYPAVPGDSGGGLFNMKGQIVGMIWGSDFRSESLATWMGPAIKYVNDNETCLRWRRRQPPPQPKPSPKQEPTPQPQPKVEPPKVEPPKVEPPKVEPPKVEPPKAEPKPEPPKPVPPQETWFDLLWPSLLVVLGYCAFMITFGTVQWAHFRRHKQI